MCNEREYVKISNAIRKEIEEKFYASIIREFRREEVEENFYKYEVVLQDIKFVTYMSDKELRLSVGLAIDLLEELRQINNSGINRQVFEQIVKENEEENENEVLQVLGIWNRISTEKMAELFARIDKVRRVGGAWAMLIANPGLISAICAVYERLVNRFEDEEMYELSGYFLLRAIMRMHSDEVEAFS